MSISSIPQRSAIPPQNEEPRDFATFTSITASFEAAPNLNAWSNPSPQEDSLSINPTHAQVTHAVQQVNNAFTQKGQNLLASLEKDKETGIHVVKLVDTTTKEVVSQYPSKQIVAIAAALTQYQEGKGQLLDTRA